MMSRDNYRLSRPWSDDYPLGMMKTFRDALLERAGGAGKPSLRAVADETGVSYEQLKKVRQGKSQSTNAEDALKIASFFGMTLNEFLDDQMAEDRAAVVETYNSLSPEERQLLRDAANGRAGRSRGAS